LPLNSKILVIDDNKDIANAFKEFLEIDGFSVDAFNDPLIALDYFRSKLKENAMVISDVRMPQMNGIELVSNMKAIEPKIKVIFITAYDIDNIKQDLQKHNYEIEEIFQKPISMITLCEKVRKYFAKGK
jgi:DNA-binding NtrC family response regulator